MRKQFTKYFGYTTKNTTEGGSSRNNAIIGGLRSLNCEMFIFFPSSKLRRLFWSLMVLFKFLFYKKEKLFIHYSVLRYLFTDKLICNRIVLSLLFMFINKLDQANKIIFEINDLPFEQSIDLELPKNDLYKLDSRLFNLNNAHFVFASESMRAYVINKYGLANEKTSVLINGAPKLERGGATLPKLNSKILGLVYAGSLNRGRQIEALINIFNNSKHCLYLLGDSGEWITDLTYLGSNVKYLGAMDEKSAHNFVAKCDIGLIPYEDSRFYYNLCFPTKASFYITAGIPFISTNLKELQLHFNENIAIYENIDNWRTLTDDDLIVDRIKQMQLNISQIYYKYEWEYLINKWMDG